MRQHRRPATSRDQLHEIYAALDRLARQYGRIETKLDYIGLGVERLTAKFGYAVRAERERDQADMATTDEIIAQLEEANTKQDAFLVILNELKAAQNDPAKLQAIAQSIGSQQADWEAAFAANTEVPPEEPPVEEPPVEEPPVEPPPFESRRR